MKFKIKWLQVAVYATLGLCIGLTIAVIVIATSRKSGSTGIDAAQIQRLRYEASQKDAKQ